MSEEIRDRDVVLAMDTQDPIIAEIDNDVALEIDTPNDIEITLEQPEVMVQELSGDNAIGMIAGSLSTFAKEKTLADGIASITKKVDNINLSVVAQEATLSAVYEAVLGVKDNMSVTLPIPEHMITDIANGRFDRDAVSMFSTSAGMTPMGEEDIQELVDKVYNNIKIEE
jgi:hypothetical protein